MLSQPRRFRFTPDLAPDEQITFSASATRNGVDGRLVDGRLYLTNRRLIHRADRFDYLWSCRLGRIESVEAGRRFTFGQFGLVAVGYAGIVEIFCVRNGETVTAAIRTAIEVDRNSPPRDADKDMSRLRTSRVGSAAAALTSSGPSATTCSPRSAGRRRTWGLVRELLYRLSGILSS